MKLSALLMVYHNHNLQHTSLSWYRWFWSNYFSDIHFSFFLYLL